MEREGGAWLNCQKIYLLDVKKKPTVFQTNGHSVLNVYYLVENTKFIIVSNQTIKLIYAS